MQRYWERAYEMAKEEGFSAQKALKIANKALDYYVPPKEVHTGKKSVPQNITRVDAGSNIIDVLIGYPELDIEAMSGGLYLDPSGWQKVPESSLMGDINHFHYDIVNGNPNQLDEKWHGFTVQGEPYVTPHGEMRARVKIPDTDLGKEFLQDWNSGKYGVSAEYRYNLSALEESEQGFTTVKDWEITGFTFEEDPSYTKTKPIVTKAEEDTAE